MAIPLTLPVTVEQVRALRVGDEVLVSGRLFTARDVAHRYLSANDDPAVRAIATGSFVYHCGPVVSQDPASKQFRFVAAGPTTSIREEPWQAEVIARYGLRGVIGKGGMGARTLEALRQHGAVYLHAVGGLAVVLAKCVTRVEAVHKLEEFGIPEAIWCVEVKDFPAVVTMDSHGKSLHEATDGDAARIAKELMERKVG
ncbi:MAG TPA: FumA C-terminus/TtdB family hydratase beta subunit [Anaeromyxobacteraceae bacterium]|nr:FumA C-terminus/TtdB family hydratase beta subunit [Anaeromyxobacteraceae bacterium]